MEDFEATASYLLPYDPVAKKRAQVSNTNKRGVGEISDTSGEANVSSGTVKASRGKTGVELRFHTKDEYRALNHEQRLELRNFRMNSKGSGTKTAGASNKKAKTEEGNT